MFNLLRPGKAILSANQSPSRKATYCVNEIIQLPSEAKTKRANLLNQTAPVRIARLQWSAEVFNSSFCNKDWPDQYPKKLPALAPFRRSLTREPH